MAQTAYAVTRLDVSNINTIAQLLLVLRPPGRPRPSPVGGPPIGLPAYARKSSSLNQQPRMCDFGASPLWW